MSYTALARKWRPKNFAELIGQEHVRRALENALASGRVHHAFLFSGTRGVGKTTIARILAKCLNCEKGVTPEPDGTCASCREIDAGRFPDLIEVDAASRTKVDDTRELLDNVQYAPARGRYKVYLIDEVHMLSAHSFNALLKTLEEPPPHVKFLLATTDPQKLPVTVLSRCLQFNLKRLPAAAIGAHMQYILEKEGVPFEAAGLKLVAQAADGSMRDGLSLLDQLIAFGGGKAGEAEARAMLGTLARDHVVRLAELLASANTAELLRGAQSLEEFAPDYAQVLDELAALLVRVGFRQALADYAGDELYEPQLLERLARALTPEDVQLYYQTAIIGRRDLALAPDPRSGFEMTLLRMLAFRPAGAELGTPAAGGAARAAAVPPRPQAEAAGSGTVLKGAPAAPATTAADSPWAQIVSRLELAGAARQLAHHCVFIARQGAVVRLALDPRNQLVRTPAQEEKLAQALSRYYGETVRLEFQAGGGSAETPAQAQRRGSEEEQAAARRAFEDEAGVQGLRERFGATVLPDTVRPVK
ncbi:MAG TPA: DNA polymerase III subunit gamma/tau [Steroidobacteraceae bacterium]|jgi:DNA polymerase-3 subunit gamma/tau|nr:DNA polymerase III subunit gamma/tau [Steroidobacteraceae bacterium]